MSPREFDMSDYVDVPERLSLFAAKHPGGSLQSEVIAWPTPELSFIAVEAKAYRSYDDSRPGVGLAWEPFPGRTPYTKDSELQNAETSAWGRAIVAVLAADTKRGIASKEEVRNRRDVSPVPNAGERSEGAAAMGKGPAPSDIPSDGQAQEGIEGHKPPPAAPSEDVLTAGPSDTPPSQDGPEVPARGASRPVCRVNGPQHRPDPERTAKAVKGFVVCACGDAVPAAEAAAEWAPVEQVTV